MKATSPGVLCADFFEFKNRTKEINIRVYITVHTGAKISDGGLKAGLFNVLYHVKSILKFCIVF